MAPLKLIAVTGGIATGKSEVSRLLAAALDCPSCSCDEIVHQLLASAPVVERIAAWFPQVLSGSGKIDRGRLGQMIFSDEENRRMLEDLLHPMVLREIEAWQIRHQSTASIGVVEVPLLYEVDFPLKRDVDVVVACSERTQMERLALRDGVNGRGVDRIAAQMPIFEKILRAEVVIWNEGSLGTLSRLVAFATRRVNQKTQ